MEGDWVSDALPFTLAALKIVGVVGAFYGLSERNRERGNRRRRVAILFLAVAVGAEMTDAIIKRREGFEMAFRFERLARPLGPISVDLRVASKFSNSQTNPYMQKLALWHNGPDPIPLPENAEDSANDVLSFAPNTTVFFFQPPTPVGKTLAREPDLSFSIRPSMSKRWPDWWKSDAGTAYLEQRQFQLVEGLLESSLESLNTSDERYSNGKIASIVDLYRSQLVIRLCSPTEGTSVTLKTVDLVFPGKQEAVIAASKFVEYSESEGCNLYYYTFPATREEFNRLLTP